MSRQADWQQERRDAMRREAWSLFGPNRVVNVVPVGRPSASNLKGYVCLEKSILGKTPTSIEAILGLPLGFLAGGCRVYRLRRLPMTLEVEYELTAKHPNGQAFNAAMHDPAYSPGSSAVHQWRLLVEMPVELLADLSPDARFPYLHSRRCFSGCCPVCSINQGSSVADVGHHTKCLWTLPILNTPASGFACGLQ
jgi:hypothetical protein